MAIHLVGRQTFTRPSPQVAQTFRLPAPTSGIDAITNLASQDPNYCIFAYNLYPSTYGMRIRRGYREWCKDLETGPGLGFGVRTLIPFKTPIGTTNDKLFAVTNEGIWDVSVYDTPSLVLTFADQTGRAGWGVYTHYVNQADLEIIFYADYVNGLFQYDTQAGTWSQAAGINGPAVTDIVFIMNHKQRLWLIEREATNAWYLPVASQSGDATEFFFGSKFAHGGDLMGLFNWTVDGGEGVDDYLCAVSRGGDVIPYKGSDPSSSNDWENIGTFYIGEVPIGGRLNGEHGGNLYLLSSLGLTSMNEMTRGIDTSAPNRDNVTYRVTPLVRERLRGSLSTDGWSVQYLPSYAGLFITTPHDDAKGDEADLQFYYNVETFGWALFRDMPVSVIDEFRGNPYIGSTNNTVYALDVFLDNVEIAPADPLVNGKDIEFSILSVYTSCGQPTLYKRPKYVRADFLGRQAPRQTTKILFDYQLNEIAAEVFPPLGNSGIWDTSLWNQAIWLGSAADATAQLFGTWGIGRMFAIATRGFAREDIVLLDWDIVYDLGAPV